MQTTNSAEQRVAMFCRCDDSVAVTMLPGPAAGTYPSDFHVATTMRDPRVGNVAGLGGIGSCKVPLYKAMANGSMRVATTPIIQQSAYDTHYGRIISIQWQHDCNPMGM